MKYGQDSDNNGWMLSYRDRNIFSLFLVFNSKALQKNFTVDLKILQKHSCKLTENLENVPLPILILKHTPLSFFRKCNMVVQREKQHVVTLKKKMQIGRHYSCILHQQFKDLLTQKELETSQGQALRQKISDMDSLIHRIQIMLSPGKMDTSSTALSPGSTCSAVTPHLSCSAASSAPSSQVFIPIEPEETVAQDRYKFLEDR